MTKRSLYITILILAVLDLAAAAWWAAGHFNSDGRARLFDNYDNAVMADTVPNVAHPVNDDYRTLNGYTFYSATSYSGGEFTDIIRVKAIWPVKINGEKGLAELKEALIGKMFGKQYDDIKQAFDSTLAHPKFVGGVHNVKRLGKMPATVAGRGMEHYYMAYPYVASDRLVEFRIERSIYDGYQAQHEVAMAHYDRVRQQVITLDMVLDLSKKDEVLKHVNSRINRLVDANGLKLRNTPSLPQEFMLTSNGIIFFFPAGTIADVETGPIEVKVFYKELWPLLSSYFKEIAASNAHFKIYDRPEWNSNPPHTKK